MNVKRNVVPVFAALAVFGLLSASAVSAYGYGWVNRLDDSEREALRTAVENGDYEAWREAMESRFSEENFELIVERYTVEQERRDAIEAAFEAEDYDAWVEAVQMDGRAPRITEQVTEDNFPLVVELHEARQAGDMERADEIQEELGFSVGSGFCDGAGFGKAHKAGNRHGMRFDNGF